MMTHYYDYNEKLEEVFIFCKRIITFRYKGWPNTLNF